MTIPLLTLLTLSSILTGYLAFAAWRARPAGIAVPFFACMAVVTVWIIGYIFEISLPGLEMKVFWVKVEYLGIAALPVTWFWLACEYAGRGDLLRTRRAAGLLLVPGLVLLSVWTYPLNRLYWTSVELVQVGSFEVFHGTFGPLFWIHAAYAYALAAVGALILLRTIFVSPALHRRGAVVLLLGGLIPVISNLPYVFDLGEWARVDLAPVAFALLSPIMAWGILRFRVLDLFPVAFDHLLQNMGDGLIILDSRLRILYMNSAAERILEGEMEAVRGRTVTRLPGLAQLRLMAEKGPSIQEIRLEGGQGAEWYEVRVSSMDARGHTGGKMLIFRSITESKNALEALRRRTEELAALNATLLELATSQDLEALLDAIVSRAIHLLGGTGGEIYLAEDRPAPHLRCVVAHTCPYSSAGHMLKFGEGAAGAVAQTGRPLIVQNYHEWPQRVEELPCPEEGVIHLVSAPLLWRSRVIGVLSVIDTSEGQRYSDDDMDLLVLFAGQAAIAVENARLFEAEQRRAQEAETIRLAAMTVAATLNQEDAVLLILEQLEKVVPYDTAQVQLYENGYLEIVGGRPGIETLLGRRFRIPGNNPNTLVIQERRAQVFNEELCFFEDFLTENNGEVKSYLGVPLLAYGQVIGMLAILSNQENFFTEAHVRLATTFAGHVAITIEKTRLYGEAHQRAEELSRLYQAARDMAASLEPAVVLEQLARHITQAVDATSGYILEVEPDYNQIKLVAEYWSTEAAPKEQVPKLGRVFDIDDQVFAQHIVQNKVPVSFHTDDPQLTEQIRSIFQRNMVISGLIIPILGRGHLLGAAVLCESRHRREFTPFEASLVQALAQHGAGVIENARLYNAVRRRANELDALRATMTDLSSELDLPRLLEAVTHRAAELIGASGGDLGIFHPETQEIEIVVSYNMGKDYSGTRMGLGEGAMGMVAKSHAPLIISDYQAWSKRSTQYLEHPFHAVIAAPLLMGGELLGVLGMMDTNPGRQFTYADQYLISLFAQQAAIAIQNSRLYESARQAAERRATLHQISQEIILAHLNPEAIYEAIHHAAERLMPAEAFAISLHEAETHTISAVYLVDRSGRAPGMILAEGAGLSGYVISSGKSLIVDDVLTFNEVDSIQFGDGEDVRSLVAVPMRLGDKTIGVISSQCYKTHAYHKEDQYLLEMLAAYAAIALYNAQLFSEVQYLAVTDPLTGVPNRRQFFALAQREFIGAQRFQRKLSAIMIDLDSFKSINDTYGHQTGDMILVEVAQVLKENIRQIDILARYGGDEFAILLPEADLDTSLQIAERLREKIEEAEFRSPAGKVTVSISVGVAAISEEISSLESMIASADTAMYAAKQSGRNQTIHFSNNIITSESLRRGMNR
jgi:diguanylate cyclase (GGDEF)-like protein